MISHSTSKEKTFKNQKDKIKEMNVDFFKKKNWDGFFYKQQTKKF